MLKCLKQKFPWLVATSVSCEHPEQPVYTSYIQKSCAIELGYFGVPTDQLLLIIWLCLHNVSINAINTALNTRAQAKVVRARARVCRGLAMSLFLTQMGRVSNPYRATLLSMQLTIVARFCFVCKAFCMHVPKL